MRDDFTEPTKRTLAARVNHQCSNPGCRAQTSGPQVDPAKALNVGVAAHITAAAPGGPRYDESLNPQQRIAALNAIWLCQNCAKLIDNGPTRFTADEIRLWKQKAEEEALGQIGKTAIAATADTPIVDKWVSMGYERKSGIASDLESQGYRLYWSNSKDENERIDLEGWEHALIDQTNGSRAKLKIEQSRGYLALLKKREEQS